MPSEAVESTIDHSLLAALMDAPDRSTSFADRIIGWVTEEVERRGCRFRNAETSCGVTTFTIACVGRGGVPTFNAFSCDAMWRGLTAKGLESLIRKEAASTAKCARSVAWLPADVPVIEIGSIVDGEAVSSIDLENWTYNGSNPLPARFAMYAASEGEHTIHTRPAPLP